MSAIRGFTCAGTALGSLLGIKSIVFPEVTQNLERIRTAEDASDAGKQYCNNYVEGPIRVTFDWNATLHATLRTRAKAQTTDTITAAKTGYCTYVGVAFVQSVGDKTFGADAKPEFTVSFEPETDWTVS